jgi:hypothetical protein
MQLGYVASSAWMTDELERIERNHLFIEVITVHVLGESKKNHE